MPKSQVANVPIYDVGCPVTEAVVLKFRVRDKQGGKLQMAFIAEDSDAALTFTVQVSVDGVTYTDTTAAENQTAVADLSVNARTRRDRVVFLRPQIDNFVQIQASGGGRGQVEIRRDDLLDIIKI